MSLDHDENQKKRRHSIQAILKDESRTPLERRRSILLLMDGRRMSNDNIMVSPNENMHEEEGEGRRDPSVRTTSRTLEQTRPPCTHYKRNCSIVSPCCGRVFGCRLCHDEALEMSVQTLCVECTPEINSSPMNNTDHKIDRFAIQEIICRLCFTRQNSKTYVFLFVWICMIPKDVSYILISIEPYVVIPHLCLFLCYLQTFSRSLLSRDQCVYCHVRFGEYHCSICNLWMSEDNHPFHCTYCGFCRIRGQNKAPFQHCHQCGMCILEEAIHDHNCQKEKYKTNCPICFEDLFSSRTAVHEMNCGHSIHWNCFQKLMNNTTDIPDTTISRTFLHEYTLRCPLCKKSADPHEEMRPMWDALATAIRLQPVPSQYAQVVTILCNDCENKAIHRPWHFLGVQCMECLSFNTVIVETELSGEAAVAFLRGLDSFD